MKTIDLAALSVAAAGDGKSGKGVGIPRRFEWGAKEAATVPSEAKAKTFFEMKQMKAVPTKLSARAVEVSLADLVEYDAMGNIDVLVPHDADLVAFFAAELGVDLDREFTLCGEKARFLLLAPLHLHTLYMGFLYAAELQVASCREELWGAAQRYEC